MLSERCPRDDQSPWWRVPRWATVPFTGISSFWSEILSAQFSCSAVSYSLQSHGLQPARLPCPSPAPRIYSNSHPSSRWCHPTISSSAFNLSQHQGLLQWLHSSHQVVKGLELQLQPSVLPMNIQDWFPLGWTCWISLPSKGLSRVFSNTTVQKHQFFSAQLSL